MLLLLLSLSLLLSLLLLLFRITCLILLFKRESCLCHCLHFYSFAYRALCSEGNMLDMNKPFSKLVAKNSLKRIPALERTPLL